MLRELFTGAVAATTVTNSGAGTLAYTGAMTGVTNLSGGGSVTVGGNHGGVIDNTSGSAGSGSATIAAGINVTGNIGGTNSLASVTFSGASTQTGSVAATTINVAGAGTTVAFTNFDVTGVLNFSAAGTATVTADEKIVGSVTTATTNTGTLTFATTTAVTTLVSGNVGSSSALLTVVNAGSNGNVATFGGEVNATTINITNTAAGDIVAFSGSVNGTTLNFAAAGTINMAANASITAATVTANDGTGTLNFAGTSTVTGLVGVIGANELLAVNVNGGTVTFKNNIGARTFNTAAGATFKTDGAIAIDSNTALTNNGTWDLGGTLTLTTATPDISATASTINLAPVSAYTGGVVISNTAANINASNTVTLVPDASFTSGTLTVVDTNAGGGTANIQGSYAVTGNALASYAVTIDGSNDVILTATANSSSAIATTLGVSEEAASAASSASSALATVSSAQDVATQAAYNTAIQAGGATAKQAVEQIQGSPANLSAVGSAAVSATGSQVIAVGTSRLASLRSGSQFASSQASGFAGGAAANNYGIWMKPFVNFGDQDQRTGIAGYETETYGLAFGGDVKVGDAKRTTLGISFSYANTDIDSKGAGRARTDINSYQGTLYADYTSNKWYVEGLVGFARNQIDTSRSIAAGNLTAAADYGSNQFMINIGGGMPMEIAKNHFLTPNASFQYTLVENETYTETGAGALNLRVDQDEVHIAMGIFGARYHTRTEMKSGTLTPEIRTAVTYDFAGDEGQSTSTFNGGGAAFSVQGADVVQLGYTAGLGLSYAPLAEQGLTISANYDWNQKTDFIGHSANFALRYEF
ncbi:MAG: autotransporter domain-containing protein [Nitrospinaceae bacterium]|nr:autotransporter domain-containing protein [Nitrospinaceae bacterium]